MPNKIESIIPILKQALVYEFTQGSFSAGRDVRDAACYLAWSFARAFAPEVLKPFVLDLSRSLLITTLFDREVNCRRAAASAFQEHVGR